MMGLDVCAAAFDRVGETYPRLVPWFNWKTITGTYETLTSLNLTGLAFFLTPLLCLLAWWRVDRAWKLRRAESVFGDLPVDYALGSDAITQARGGGGPLSEAYVSADDLTLGWLNQRLRDQPWGNGPRAKTPAVPRRAAGASAASDGA
jgi:hypothetical protein